MEDYYQILGVDKSASTEDINKAFRKLAHKHHPDKKGGDEVRFKKINEAYQVLKDSNKRKQYDAGGFSDQGFGDFDFSGFQGGFQNSAQGDNIADFINSMFRSRANRGEDILIDVVINFKESVMGMDKKIKIPYRRKSTEIIDVKIPSGIENGNRLHYQGRGEPAKGEGGINGDLYVRIYVKEDLHYKRQGNNLIYTLALTPTEALLGINKSIKSVNGDVINVSVPKLSKEGSTIVFDGKGINIRGFNGDLVIYCHLVYPKNMSNKVEELLHELKNEGW